MAWLLIFIFIVVLLACIPQILQLIDWVEQRKQAKTSLGRFNADLHKLQMKYYNLGEYGFAKSIFVLMEHHNPEIEDKPETEYGKELERAIKERDKEIGI